MIESQRKWLLDLQKKGVRFQQVSYLKHSDDYNDFNSLGFAFKEGARFYELAAQPIPDVPDWREVCTGMQSKGIEFEMVFDLDREIVINPGKYEDAPRWSRHRNGYSFTDAHISCFRIPQQPLPKWKEEPHPVQYLDALQDRPEIHTKAVPEKSFKMGRKEEMTEETKPEPPEPPHRDLQIQWHEDWIHSLKTGEPMREWEFKDVEDDEWTPYSQPGIPPKWYEEYEYRRKPRKVSYWHCVVEYGYNEEVGIEKVVLWSTYEKDELKSEIQHIKENNPTAKFTPITETTAELAD